MSPNVAVRPDQATTATDGVGRQRRDTHRDDRSFRAWQRPHGSEELLGTAAVDDAQDGVTTLRQAERLLPSILGLLVSFDEPASNQTVHQPARGRRRPPDRFGQLADGQGAAVREDVERRQLGETESQLAELAGESDHQLAPQRTTHRHPLADLADIRQSVAGREDWGRKVGFEAAGDRPGWGRARRWTGRGSIVTHGSKATGTTEIHATVQPNQAWLSPGPVLWRT
jgi:hypothetical protein